MASPSETNSQITELTQLVETLSRKVSKMNRIQRCFVFSNPNDVVSVKTIRGRVYRWRSIDQYVFLELDEDDSLMSSYYSFLETFYLNFDEKDPDEYFDLDDNEEVYQELLEFLESFPTLYSQSTIHQFIDKVILYPRIDEDERLSEFSEEKTPSNSPAFLPKAPPVPEAVKKMPANTRALDSSTLEFLKDLKIL